MQFVLLGGKATEICKTKSSHRLRPKALYKRGKCQNELSVVQAIKRRLLGCVLLDMSAEVF
jgi:hypothetical protein